MKYGNKMLKMVGILSGGQFGPSSTSYWFNQILEYWLNVGIQYYIIIYIIYNYIYNYMVCF